MAEIKAPETDEKDLEKNTSEKTEDNLPEDIDTNNDPDGDDDPLNDEEYKYALERSETNNLDDSDRLDILSPEELDSEASQDWDEDSGLVVDIHKQYDDMIGNLEQKKANGELSEEEATKLEQMKQELQNYNDEGLVADGKAGLMSPQYPENDGFFGEKIKYRLDESEIISRYDPIDSRTGETAKDPKTGEDISGRYASPDGTDYYSRAMPYDESKRVAHYYRLEPGAELVVTKGEVRDFFENKGTGATQYMFDKRISEYVKEGKMYECDKAGNRL